MEIWKLQHLTWLQQRKNTNIAMSSQLTLFRSARTDVDGDQVMLTAVNQTQFTQTLLLFVSTTAFGYPSLYLT